MRRLKNFVIFFQTILSFVLSRKISYKNILIYYTAYVTMNGLKYLKINTEELLYLIFSKMNGYFEEINRS